LYDFNDISGSEPYGSLILDQDASTLYGLTYNRGANGHGTIFKFELYPKSGFTKLRDFATLTGADPRGSLLKVGSTLFGMTSTGGANSSGTIFKILTDGSNFTTIFDFDLSTTGGTPFGSLIISGDKLYGMAYDGGPGNLGVIFSIDTTGNNYTVLHGFSGDEGKGPYGEVTLDGTTLYGMTKYGGNDNFGVIFKIQTNGNGYTKMFDFDWTNTGGYPDGSLTLYDNYLYGMAAQGGAHSVGVIFRISTSGAGFTKLLDFKSTTTGEYPWGNLIVYDNMLHGMVDGNGTVNYGSIFRIGLDGSSYEQVYEFTDPLNGSQPRGTHVLIPFLNGVMYYGMMQTGGTNDMGVIFSYQNTEIGISPVTGQKPVSIYPNPAKDLLKVSSFENIRSIRIIDLPGKEVFQDNPGLKEIIIPIENLKSGVYFLRIELSDQTLIRKFIKE
jgi:uncharacterized repeat protein (TIGR03803 family)